MTPKYSGRAFRKVVWKSSKEVWCRLHEQAFRYFGGCPQYVTLDNLKEGVIKPDPSSPFTRLLLHPHETEQPFTRSQSAIAIPEGLTEVRVRAHDLVDGFGGREVVVGLTVTSGPDFEVER